MRALSGKPEESAKVQESASLHSARSHQGSRSKRFQGKSAKSEGSILRYFSREPHISTIIKSTDNLNRPSTFDSERSNDGSESVQSKDSGYMDRPAIEIHQSSRNIETNQSEEDLDSRTIKGAPE